jgi:hypothetical protein
MRVLRRMAVDPHWSRRQVKPVKSVVPEIFRSEITLFFWFGCNVSESYIASKKLGAIGQKAVTPQACSLIGGAMAFEELYNARNKRIIFISGRRNGLQTTGSQSSNKIARTIAILSSLLISRSCCLRRSNCEAVISTLEREICLKFF